MTVYPYTDGDVTVLGPQVFASSDEKVINWKGENYYQLTTVERVHRAMREMSRIVREVSER